jgi:hypothetical protein
MSGPLKLHSADSGVGRVRLYPDDIEAYFEYDSSKGKSEFEKLFEALQADIIKWGKEAQNILKKSKSEKAAELLSEYDEIYEDFIAELSDEDNGLKEYRIIKMTTGTFYTVSETIEEIDTLIEENEYNEKYGFNGYSE